MRKGKREGEAEGGEEALERKRRDGREKRLGKKKVNVEMNRPIDKHK